MGIVARTTIAISGGQLVWNSVRKKVNAIGIVKYWRSSKTSGQKNAFHVPWNWRIATADSAGVASGSITRQNVVKKPAPSIRAASSMSRGIDRKYCRIRKTFVPITAMTRTTPRYSSGPRVRPIRLRRR